MPKKSKKTSNIEFPFMGTPDDVDLNVDYSELEKELQELMESNLNDDPSSDSNDNAKLLAELEQFASADDDPQPTSIPKPALSVSGQSGVTQSEVDNLVALYLDALMTVQDSQPVNSTLAERYQRVLDQVQSIAGRVEAGEHVERSELPPPPNTATSVPEPESKTAPRPAGNIAPPLIPTQSSPTMPAASAQPTPMEKALVQLKARGHEYKLAAVKARDAGETKRAKDLLAASKFIEDMLPKIRSGEEEFDPESDMPPPPDEYEGAPDEPEVPDIPKPPPAPSTEALPAEMLSPIVTAENLKLRMDYFKVRAQQTGSDASAARRYHRVSQDYMDALRAFSHQVKSFNFSELPPPPGCPVLTKPQFNTKPPSTGSGANPPAAAGTLAVTADDSRTQKVVKMLQTRQAELKSLALKAKQSGDMNTAKTHLRAALSLNPMIESAQAGLPVDLSKVPRVPRPANEMTITMEPIMTGQTTGIPADLHLALEAASNDMEKQKLLLKVLQTQSKEADSQAAKFTDAGYSQYATKLTSLSKLSQANHKFLLKCIEQKRVVPYEFELTTLPQLNVNCDLGDDSLEITVLRGITLPVPSSIGSAEKLDTQVELRLPYPSNDEAQTFTTKWVKHTRDPIYVENSVFRVDRKSRTFQLLIKGNRGLKATVYYSRGFLRSAGTLGTVNFPLSQLNQSIDFSVVGDLMDGRKAVGGRLEIKIRQRAVGSGPPVVSYQKPWLVLKPPESTTTNVRQKSACDQPGARNDSNNEHKNRSPQKVLITKDRRSPSDKSSSGSQDQQPESKKLAPNGGMYSMDVLKRDRDYYRNQLGRQDLPPEKRDKYESKLCIVDQLITRLQSRLSGSNAAEEMRAYLGELKTLYEETKLAYQSAREKGDSRQIQYYKETMDVIREEMDKYASH